MENYLSSASTHYRLEHLLGQGSYGKVVKCTRMTDMKTVAIKMLKNDEYLRQFAKAEVSALKKLRWLDPDNCNIVRWYSVFTDMEYICLEFEHLDRSLYDFMRERHFKPLSLNEIRLIVKQLSTALYHLKTVDMIHADLKLENIMLVDHVRQPYRVKLIDFGLACDVSEADVCPYIQSRPYRAPEIILGLPFSESIDMWSLGCTLVSLYIGSTLYPGKNEYDMIRYMVGTQGPIPEHLLRHGLKTGQFFQREDHSTNSHWNLKTPEQFQQETGIQVIETSRVRLMSLDDLLYIRTIIDGWSVGNAAEEKDLLMFVKMIKGMLQFDPAKRLTPHQVLGHPFVTMAHMSSICSHVKSCNQLRKVCQKTQHPNCMETVVGSLQQSFNRTAQPSHSPILCTPCPFLPDPRLPPPRHPLPPPCPLPPTERSSLSQLRLEKRADDEAANKGGTSQTHGTSLRRGTEEAKTSQRHTPAKSVSTIQDSTDLKQGIKRKMADDDLRGPPSKRTHEEEGESAAAPVNHYWCSSTQSFLPRQRNSPLPDDQKGQPSKRTHEEEGDTTAAPVNRYWCSSTQSFLPRQRNSTLPDDQRGQPSKRTHGEEGESAAAPVNHYWCSSTQSFLPRQRNSTLPDDQKGQPLKRTHEEEGENSAAPVRRGTEEAKKSQRPTAAESVSNIQDNTALKQCIKRKMADDVLRGPPLKGPHEEEGESAAAPVNRYWCSSTQSFLPRQRNSMLPDDQRGQPSKRPCKETGENSAAPVSCGTEEAKKSQRPTAAESVSTIEDSTALRQGIKGKMADDDLRGPPSNSYRWKRPREEVEESAAAPVNHYWCSFTQSFLPRRRKRQNNHV